MDQTGRDPEGSGEKMRSGWIRQGEIQMDQAIGGFVSSSKSTDGVLEEGRSSEYEEKPKKAKIEFNRAKIDPKRIKIKAQRVNPKKD